MEATWDDQMLWRSAEDVDELVIPGWAKALDIDVADDVFFKNVMVPEPKSNLQADEDVVVQDAHPRKKPRSNPQPDEDAVVQDAHPLKKVELHPDDALFQQQLGNAEAQCTNQAS